MRLLNRVHAGKRLAEYLAERGIGDDGTVVLFVDHFPFEGESHSLRPVPR